MSLITRLGGPGLHPCNLRRVSKDKSQGVLHKGDRVVCTEILALYSHTRKIPRWRRAFFPHDSLPLPSCKDKQRLCTVQVNCTKDGGSESAFHDSNGGIKSETRSWGLLRVAALIGSATVVSKSLGLARETVLAAVFGVGPVINAYSYASIVPAFFLALLGGINGPFHSAVAASLSKRPKDEARQLIQKVTAITVVVSGALSLVIFALAPPLMDAVAPGLVTSGIPGVLTRDLAILQLKIMAPCAMLAALIGIGFGSLSTVGVYGLPSLSPALSSISIMSAVAVSAVLAKPGGTLSSPRSGSVALAAGTTVGAMAQWGLQAVALQRAGFGPMHLFGRQSNPFEDEGVREVFAVLLPAAVASGMLQVATFTDLYFASFIPGAAAGLGYANLLVMAPLGILSSSILVPMLPMFSRLSKASDKLKLQERVKQGLLLSMVMTFLLTAMLVSLAEPIVRIVFQRRAFDAFASKLVSSHLICYALGSTFSLARDLLIRVFYSLGISHVPFQISVAAISANVLLDWIAVRQAGLGVQGLVLATSFVNCVAAIALLVILSTRMEGLKLRHWVQPLSLLCLSAVSAGIVAKVSYSKVLVFLVSTLKATTARSLWVADLVSIVVAGGCGVLSYFGPLFLFQIPETQAVLKLLRAKL